MCSLFILLKCANKSDTLASLCTVDCYKFSRLYNLFIMGKYVALLINLKTYANNSNNPSLGCELRFL